MLSDPQQVFLITPASINVKEEEFVRKQANKKEKKEQYEECKVAIEDDDEDERKEQVKKRTMSGYLKE